MDRPQSYAPSYPPMSLFQKAFLAVVLILAASIFHGTRYVSTGDYRATLITDTWRDRTKVCFPNGECSEWRKQ